MSPSPKTLNKGAELLKQTKPRAPQKLVQKLLAPSNQAARTMSFSPGGISERALQCPGLLWGTHMPLGSPTHDSPKQGLQLWVVTAVSQTQIPILKCLLPHLSNWDVEGSLKT